MFLSTHLELGLIYITRCCKHRHHCLNHPLRDYYYSYIFHQHPWAHMIVYVGFIATAKGRWSKKKSIFSTNNICLSLGWIIHYETQGVVINVLYFWCMLMFKWPISVNKAYDVDLGFLPSEHHSRNQWFMNWIFIECPLKQMFNSSLHKW